MCRAGLVFMKVSRAGEFGMKIAGGGVFRGGLGGRRDLREGVVCRRVVKDWREGLVLVEVFSRDMQAGEGGGMVCV